METPPLEMGHSISDFVLRLPAPHDHIVLTAPRLEDAESILPILNDHRVYPWMGVGLPYPHQHEHALHWLSSAHARCDSAQEEFRRAQRENVAPSFFSECPVRIIRENGSSHQSVYLGDCGIQKWTFPDVLDDRRRQSLRQDNEGKPAGDPTIIWSIGYYLAPSHSGQGIMSSAIGALLRWAVASMNVRHLRTTAMEGNGPSVKVLEKNGFTIEKTLPEFASKNGMKVGLHVLEWKAPSRAQA